MTPLRTIERYSPIRKDITAAWTLVLNLLYACEVLGVAPEALSVVINSLRTLLRKHALRLCDTTVPSVNIHNEHSPVPFAQSRLPSQLEQVALKCTKQKNASRDTPTYTLTVRHAAATRAVATYARLIASRLSGREVGGNVRMRLLLRVARDAQHCSGAPVRSRYFSRKVEM